LCRTLIDAPLGHLASSTKKITPPLSPFVFCSCYIDELVQEQNKSLTIKKEENGN
jgi:hypothetical protein